MNEIYALVIICTTFGDCFEIRDRISEYKNLSQCTNELKVLKEKYKTNLIICKQGDIVEDEDIFKNFKLI